MNARPDIQELLSLARETLQNDLVPALAPGARFTAAMVANALAIAAREALDHTAADREIARAREALPEFPDERELIVAIRSGALDAPSPQRGPALRYAAAILRRRLAVTNPRHSA